jgi:hypothetical protein
VWSPDVAVPQHIFIQFLLPEAALLFYASRTSLLNMDKLPPELIDAISSHLSREDLKNTLLLSRSFCFSAEKYSYAFRYFVLDEKNAEKFLNTFSGRRLPLLRHVEFQPMLPRVEHTYSELRETAAKLRENDESYTRQIAFLFGTIKEAEDRARLQNKFGKFELVIGSPMRLVPHDFGPLSYHAHSSWRIHLLQPEALPLLASVRSVEFGKGGLRTHTRDEIERYGGRSVKLDYRVMVDLVTRLPNIEFWGCRFLGDRCTRRRRNRAVEYFEGDWAGPRRDTRHDFAKALEGVRLPDSLRRIRLDFLDDCGRPEDFDQLIRQPDLVTPLRNDPFSIGLHELSHSLRRVHLRVVADESLFKAHNNKFTSWPNLESLVVVFHIVSPTGTWYFQGPGGEGHDLPAFEVTEASYPPFETNALDQEMNYRLSEEGELWDDNFNIQMRVMPDDVTLRPFLEAFATAAANMHALKEAALWCPLAWEPYIDDEEDEEEVQTDWIAENTRNHRELAWGMYYLAPGELDYLKAASTRSESRQIIWRVAKWRPDAELHRLFQQIGSGKWNDELVENWEDEEFGEGLVDTDFFEDIVQDEVENMGRIPLLY